MSSDHIDVGASMHWGTPEQILKPVRKFFHGTIDLDPCSGPNSIVKATVEFMLPKNNGLEDSWDVTEDHNTNAFSNPPYGRTYLSDDWLHVYSQKEFSDAKKLWTALRGLDKGQPDDIFTTVKGLAISPAAAQRFKATTIYDWVEKAIVSYEKDHVNSISLIPVATDTAHWQELVFQRAQSVCFVKGRLKFRGAVEGPAVMANALVYCGDWYRDFEDVFQDVGTVVQLRK